MAHPMTAPQTWEREFLALRGKILEIAAALDRVERADGTIEGDARLAQINKALQTLARSGGDRAEQIQLIFSRSFDEGWREELGLDPLPREPR